MVTFENYQNLLILLLVFFGHLGTIRCSYGYYEDREGRSSSFSPSSSSTINDNVLDSFNGESPNTFQEVSTTKKPAVEGIHPLNPGDHLTGKKHHGGHHRNRRQRRRQHHPQHQTYQRRRYYRQLYRDNRNEMMHLDFSQREYKATVREDVPIQTSILQVRVTSSFHLSESDVELSVDDQDNFGIDRSGVLYNTAPLDYELSGGQYLIGIRVVYKGKHKNLYGWDLSATTTAKIHVTDTPDPPRFETEHYYFSVPELAATGAFVGTVKAVDDDGDFDAYTLQDVKPEGMFSIHEETGDIRLGLILAKDQQWTFDFQVVAFDFSGHVAVASVTVYMIAHLVWGTEDDENNHKPVFHECSAYDRIHVKENMTEGTPVLMVLATDVDRGDNGVVSYDLLKDFQSFKIQSSNQHGQISTTRRLDRDGDDKEFVLTVVARDGAAETLQDSCSFKVIIEDINDNPPVFDQKIYEETISTDHIIGTPVLRVTATDLDSGPNAEISFDLQGSMDDLHFFTIDGDTGIISLKKHLRKDMANRRTFEMRARATDNGNPMLWSNSSVRIQVVSSDELPPTVVSQQPLYPAILENTTENTDVLTICAKSNLLDSSFVYFTLLNGLTPHNNSFGTFAIRRLPSTNDICHDSSGVTVFVATRNLDFEAIQEYTLTLQIVLTSTTVCMPEIHFLILRNMPDNMNDHNARMEKKIRVNILDVNDNAPLLQPFDGAVLENTDSTLITTIQAHDKDVSPQFRQLRYSFDILASSDVRKKFTLKANGELWTTQSLDREEVKQYKIPIKVTDGVPAHERMTIYWITVQDLNDVPPAFDNFKGVYEVELPENREVGKSTGIKLSVSDPDVVNQFEYQVIEGNSEQKFRIDAITGDILVNKALDYDHPTFDRNFTLRVRVHDGMNAPADKNVVIAVTNVNDLQPVFEHINYNFTVTENTDCNTTFGKVSALDPDLPHTVDQNIMYYLSPIELRNFTINSSTGELSIKGCLDRESAKRGTMTLYPRANDEAGKGLDADPATVHLLIRDLNDNHPHIVKPINSYARIMENVDPDDVEPILIQLDDADGGENGCPCTVEFDPGTPPAWLQKFNLRPVSGQKSVYHLNPLVSFDREEQKVYPIPFVTRDQKGIKGTRLFTLEIGDENDSPMSDGRSRIKVFNYQGQFPSMVIGAVHVDDQDDYDLNDKMFEVDPTTSSDVANHFQVDLNSGNITMVKGTPPGIHLLRVKVYDGFREESAVGEVSINVLDLDMDAVLHSGSLTLANVKVQQMLRRSKVSKSKTLYEHLKDQIARIHKIPEANVDIFSMRDVDEGVQIRYNCHSSPYYTAARLDGLMLRSRLQVSTSLGVDVVKVNGDACLYESTSPCGKSSCQHMMRPNLTSPLVVSSNSATMVGIDITDEYTCDCGQLEPPPSVCFSGFCYNGGTCTVINNTLKCQCLDSNNYGPRCELLNARFERGFAWYKPLKSCHNSSFSVSFKSNDPNGVLLYTGPIVELPWMNYPKDFLYIFLKNWNLITYMDLGSGTLKVSIPIEQSSHRIFEYIISWHQREIVFEVLDCGINSTVEDLDPCRRSAPYPGISSLPNYLMNVQGPLQVGGVAPMVSFAALSASYHWNLIPPTIRPFSGCIFDMRHNNLLYDLNATDYGALPIQPCDAPRTSMVVLGQQSIIIIFVSLLCLLLLVLLILCLARRGKKAVSYPDLDKELVKETMGGTDLEAFGEKDVTHFDLKFLQVTPNGYIIKDEDANLPDVTQDALQCRTAPLAKMQDGLSVGEIISSSVQKIDYLHQEVDDVRHYNISGDEMSVAASLSSLASGFNSTTGSSKSDIPFDYRTDWGQRFEKIAQIYAQESDLEDDSEYEFPDFPTEKKILSSTFTMKDKDRINGKIHPSNLTNGTTATVNGTSPSKVFVNGDVHMPKERESTAALIRNTLKRRSSVTKEQRDHTKDVIKVTIDNLNRSVETWC